MRLKDIKRQIYSSTDNKLIKFTNENLEQRGSLEESEYRNNINILNQLDVKTLNIGIARMTGIK